jgi:hypothetical protein
MNPDQLRSAIDSGGTGDKVAFPDPAAAPLGTDEEAAGTPVSAAACRQAYLMETGRAQSSRIRSDRAATRRKPSPIGSIIGTLAFLAAATMVGWAFLH